MMALLDVFAGLFLVYLLFAVVVSAVQEWWSQYFGHRGQFLTMGIRRLLADESIYARVVQHPLIGNLYRDRAARGKPPAYVEPLHFAMAFANVVVRRAANTVDAESSKGAPAPPPELDFANLRAAVCLLSAQRSPVAYAALPIIDKAGGDLHLALQGLADWYSAAMDRVGGWYKAYAQRRLFVFGFLLAAMANINTIEIFSALNHSSLLRAQVAALADEVARTGTLGGVDLAGKEPLTPQQTSALLTAAQGSALGKLPVGYACLSLPWSAAELRSPEALSRVNAVWTRCTQDLHGAGGSFAEWLLRILGWALTALAGVIGAPYWFSALSKVVSIRGSGAKPRRDPTVVVRREELSP